MKKAKVDSKVSRYFGEVLFLGTIICASIVVYAASISGTRATKDVHLSPSPASPIPIEEQKGVECFGSRKSVLGKICVVPRDSI